MRTDRNGILRLDHDIEKLIREKKHNEAYALLCSKYPEEIVNSIRTNTCTSEEYNTIPSLDAEAIRQGADFFKYAGIYGCSPYEHSREVAEHSDVVAEAERLIEAKRQIRIKIKNRLKGIPPQPIFLLNGRPVAPFWRHLPHRL